MFRKAPLSPQHIQTTKGRVGKERGESWEESRAEDEKGAVHDGRDPCATTRGPKRRDR